MSHFDAFICHSSADKEAARQLAHRLKSAGLRIWIDEEQIGVGDPITRRIEEGLDGSRYVIVCLSKWLKQSSWCRAEYGSMLHRELTQNSTRVLPVMIEEHAVMDLPVLLADKAHVDVRTTTGFDELLRKLKSTLSGEQSGSEAHSPRPPPTLETRPPPGNSVSSDPVDPQSELESLNNALRQAMRQTGLDDKTLIVLSDAAIGLNRLLQNASEYTEEMEDFFWLLHDQLEARLSLEVSPDIRRLFLEHQKELGSARERLRAKSQSRSDVDPGENLYSFPEIAGVDVSQGLKNLLSRDALEQSDGIEWVLRGGFAQAATRLEQIKDAGRLDDALEVLWRRLARVRLYHTECFAPLFHYMLRSNEARWRAKLIRVRDCCAEKMRLQDAQALLDTVDSVEKLVLASCLLTNRRPECRRLAMELLPPTERWDVLLYPHATIPVIYDLLKRIRQDCGADYIKVAFLLLRPKLASVKTLLEVSFCYEIMKLFYCTPLFLEDSFFSALEELYEVVSQRANASPKMVNIASECVEEFKAFFRRQPVEDAKVYNMRSIPLPVQRKLAHDGHFIEYFICSTRDPIALETIPHVLRREDVVVFFRIAMINATVLEKLASDKQVSTSYRVKVAFCKNPKAKPALLRKVMPGLMRSDLRALALDKMANSYAREYAKKLLAVRSQ